MHHTVSKSASVLVCAITFLLCAGLQAQTLNAAATAAAPTAAPSAEAATAPSAPAKLSAATQQAATLEAAKAAEAAKGAEGQRSHVAARTAGANQFQRFVQETTGRLLPVYGRELFESPQAYAADNGAPAPDNYLLGAGDEVRLQVWGPVDFVTSLVIDRNGQVNLPKVGVVTLAGVAVRDLDKTLQSHLGKVFSNFSASATLGRLRGIQVYVVGQAQQPGSFNLSSLSTLVNALFASGGPNASGSMRAIELKRAGKTVSVIDLYDFIARGDKARDVALLSGDVIVIPPVGPRVAVTGAFDQAAIYELKTGATSVADILALGGGVSALANTQKALLERINRESNPPRQVQDIVLNAQGLQQSLRDGDARVFDRGHCLADR
ncbi:MAG: polysaccharide biosynthesis/export family protein, partial [Betaproteobacteria bacterium]